MTVNCIVHGIFFDPSPIHQDLLFCIKDKNIVSEIKYGVTRNFFLRKLEERALQIGNMTPCMLIAYLIHNYRQRTDSKNPRMLCVVYTLNILPL